MSNLFNNVVAAVTHPLIMRAQYVILSGILPSDPWNMKGIAFTLMRM